jgi:hypothetical protein
VDSYGVGLFFELLDDIRGQFILSAVVPDSNGSVAGASSYDLFLKADIHAEDGVRVERTDQVTVVLVVRRPFKVNWYFKDLIRAHGEH